MKHRFTKYSVSLIGTLLIAAAPGLLPFVTSVPSLLHGEVPMMVKKTSVLEEGENNTEESSIEKSISGFVEYENFTNTYGNQEFEDIVKKNELRNNWKIKIGTETLYFQSNLNLYVHDDNRESRVTRNMTITGNPYEISFNELYINYEFSIVRLRLGNQIHAWGTADVFNPTAYFNPMDMREALSRDEDELKQGVPSLAALFYIGDSSIELVYVPIHVPVLIPGSGTFWGIRYEERGYPVEVLDPRAMEINGQNMAVGIQFATNLWSTDFNINAYYGPDVEPIFRPIGTLALIPDQPPSAAVLPEYRISPAVGFSFSKTLGKFVFQGEVAYFPMKPGVIDQDLEADLPDFPFAVTTYHAMRSSLGINYFLPLEKIFPSHDGEAVLTIEWSRPTAFGAGEIMDPMLGDILSFRFDDTFLDSKLKVSLTSITDLNNASTMLMPEIGYTFTNGISITAAYTWLHGGDNSFLGIYTNNDFFKVRLRYEYSL